MPPDAPRADSGAGQMQDLYHQIVTSLRGLVARILEPRLDLGEFLRHVVQAAKDLDPENLEARVYEVDFVENQLYLKAGTNKDFNLLSEDEKVLTLSPRTITGDAVIENRVIIASKDEGYYKSRFRLGEDIRAAFPIEFVEEDVPEARTKYVLVVGKKGGSGPLHPDIIAALLDYSLMAGLIISIKALRDRLSQFYEENRNLVLSGRHAAAIAHDIRSLNVGVAGFLSRILRRLEKDPSGLDPGIERRNLVLARDNSRQIEALLRDFSLFNRSELVLNLDTDLAKAVGRKLESLSSRTDYQRRMTIDINLPEQETGILVDSDWFGTVIENLVRNSLEACRRKSHIKVSIEMSAELVTLVFEDNCGGIPPEMIPHIFTPFVTRKKRGQGLGMANARKVVEDHGGTIRVANREGHGAVFTIEFPRKKTAG